MPMIVESENTQTTVIGTEHTLAAPTTNKARILRADISALAVGEVVAFRVKTKVRTAGTVRDQFYFDYIGAPGDEIIETPPIASDLGATFTLTQISPGSPRSIDWKILTVDTPLVAESEGSLTTVIGTTPQQLAAPSTNKTRLLRVDLGTLIAGDTLYLGVKTKVRTAGTVRLQYYRSFINVIGQPIIETPPISGDLGATFELTHTAGSAARVIDWKILTLD